MLKLKFLITRFIKVKDIPGGSDSKESAYNARDPGYIPGWEDPLEKGMAPHSSILAWKNPMDRGVWWAIVHGGHKRVTEQLIFSV